MAKNFIEFIAKAKNLDSLMQNQDTSLEDSHLKVIDFLTSKEHYSSAQEKLNARLQIAWHIKNIVCQNYDIDPSTVGICNNPQIPKFKLARAHDWSKQRADIENAFKGHDELELRSKDGSEYFGTFKSITEFPYDYFIDISNQRIYKSDAYHFANTMCHELRHVIQYDRNIYRSDEVSKAIKKNCNILLEGLEWGARPSEKDADNFSFMMMTRFFRDAAELGKGGAYLTKAKAENRAKKVARGVQHSVSTVLAFPLRSVVKHKLNKNKVLGNGGERQK